MAKYFINVSNHPSNRWSAEQREAAPGDDILDIDFPVIPPELTSEEIDNACCVVIRKIMDLLEEGHEVASVHVAGEYTATHFLVNYLHMEMGFSVVAAATERSVEEVEGKTVRAFKFVQWREYPMM